MSLSRTSTEYRTERHETRSHQQQQQQQHHQQCGTGGAKNTGWDNHFNNLLSDLNNSVGISDKQRMRSDGVDHDFSLLSDTSARSGLSTGDRGGRGGYRERHEFTSPDRRTHVVQERYEQSGQGADNLQFSKKVQQCAYTRTQNYDNLPEPSDSSTSSRLRQTSRQTDCFADSLDGTDKRSRTPSDFNRHISAGDTSTPYHSGVGSSGLSGSSSFRHQSHQRQLQQHEHQSSSSSGSCQLPAGQGPGDTLTAASLAPLSRGATDGSGPGCSVVNPLQGLDRATVPELFEPPQPGTTRVTRYEYRRSSRQRHLSTSPERTPRPLPDTSRTTTHWQQRSSSVGSQQQQPPRDGDTVDKVVVLEGGRLPSPPPQQPGTSTTINYHIYNYGARNGSVSPPPGPDTTVSRSYVYQGSQQHHQLLQQQQQQQQLPRASSPANYPKFPVAATDTTTTTTTTFREHADTEHDTARAGRTLPRSPSPAVRWARDNGPPRPLPAAPRCAVDAVDTPKHVRELMAQMPNTPQDGTYPDGPRRRELEPSKTITLHETSRDGGHGGPRGGAAAVGGEVVLDAKSGGVVPAAQPVYYPPGSNQFKQVQTCAPQTTMQSYESSSASAGRASGGYKASGRYKAKGGYKERHVEGGTVVPLCLPLCCGAACSIM